ncbi:type II and III secretion system protein family protein [Marinobacter salinisoli]|uniref:Type II and III secretion system protein family protein n=1 Tax=Marinobacter salinisoli TaxID=2769486 RepID=A0ABX7MS54_9GAMM|nr:type II and III secretion system protein family protein [Marinobacter salinisoli]QSP94969.1 type II and III secretion system protein family protein [Marinobacter salinisoli]
MDKSLWRSAKNQPARLFQAAVMVMVANLLCAAVWAGGGSGLGVSVNLIPIYKSRTIPIQSTPARVSVGNPDIADILVTERSELYVVGKRLGSTNILVWDKNDRLVDSIDIEVTHDLNGLKDKLYRFLPDENISVLSSQGHLVLSGQVSSPERMEAAKRLADGYALAAGGEDANSEVLNMMSVGGGQQVMLEVTVAEVQRELAHRLNSDFSLVGQDGNFLGGLIGGDGLISEFGIFGSYVTNSFLYDFAIDAAKEQGLARVLAEPNITALSGQQADFLSGGEFPVPVPDDDGIKISYKEFGVGVSFVPTILGDGNINLNLDVLVSELSNANAVGIAPTGTTATIITPSIVKRSARTTVELADGQTIAIAGLLSNRVRESVNQLPGLGDVPILGQLFRSEEYLNGETELVILVTPRLAQPITREGLQLPTDGFVPPTDLEFYLLGRMFKRETEGDSGQRSTGGASSSAVQPGMRAAEMAGTGNKYGHAL